MTAPAAATASSLSAETSSFFITLVGRGSVPQMNGALTRNASHSMNEIGASGHSVGSRCDK